MLRKILLPAVILCLSLNLFGGPSIDLTRIEPVPEGTPIPAQDFFRPLLLRQPRFNDAGTHVAALITIKEDRTQLLVSELGTQKIETLMMAGDMDIYYYNWLDDRHLIFTVGKGKRWGLGWLTAELGKLSNAYSLIQNCSAHLLAVPREDRLHPLFWLSSEIGPRGSSEGGCVNATIYPVGKTGIYDLSGLSASKEMYDEIVASNGSHIQYRYSRPESGIILDYVADKLGKLEYAFTNKDGYTTMHWLENGDWKPSPLNFDNVNFVGAGDNPRQVAVVAGSRDGNTPRALKIVDATNAREVDELVQDKAYDFDGWLRRDPVSQEIIGARYEREIPVTVWFTEEYRALQKVLSSFFPGLIVEIIDSDPKRELFLVSTYSDRQPVIYYTVNLKTKQVGLFKKSCPWIDPKRMSEMKIIKFKTRDGIVLDAYLTLPEGTSKEKPAPLVVMPHGGPYLRDSWGFDPDVQYLASRGYAVLQPNYRGSTGYSWKYPRDDDYAFRKMSDDVTDATRTVIKTGFVDPARIAIMGGSFGGYLAVSGVAHEPDLYRCAVTICGVFDWEKMLREAKYDQYRSSRYVFLKRFLGDPRKNREKYEEISPINFVGNIKVPVFVQHGLEDYNVDADQSKSLISLLEKHGVPYEKLFFSLEGHGVGKLENKIKMMERIEEFLRKNLALPRP